MKKKLALIMGVAAAMCLCVGVLAGCGGNSSASSSSSAEESSSSAAGEATTLIVGFDAEYPPYGFMADDGQSYTGFDLDLAQAVCEELGWEYQAEPIDWDAKDAMLGSGAINCIWNGFTMEGREGNYTFSEPYMLNEQVVVVKADSDIVELADLEGKIVMTQVDSAALDVLEDEEGQKKLADTFAELQTIGDYNTAFLNLDSGVVDAVACDLSIAQYQLAQTDGKYVMLETPLSSEHYAVGFKLGDTETAAQVSEALAKLDADGTVKELCEKYANYGMSYDNWVLGQEDLAQVAAADTTQSANDLEEEAEAAEAADADAQK